MLMRPQYEFKMRFRVRNLLYLTSFRKNYDVKLRDNHECCLGKYPVRLLGGD